MKLLLSFRLLDASAAADLQAHRRVAAEAGASHILTWGASVLARPGGSMDGNDVVATGIAGLDALFFDRIRRGNLVVVKGEPGSGKTLLGTEFIYRGATLHDEPGLIVVFESNPVVLRRDAAYFGCDLAELERQNKVKIIATSPQVLDQEVRSASGVLLQTARDMGARRIFIDNVALLGAMASQNHAPANGNGHASARAVQSDTVLQSVPAVT